MKPNIIKKTNKPKYKGEPVKITLATLTLIALCTFLIVIATFTQFSFNHYIIPSDALNYLDSDFSNPETLQHFTKHYRYIPQIPAIMFIIVLLGRTFSLISILLYIIIGLCGYPVFALGGGVKYVLEYGFGYIMAYLPAAFFSGSIMKSGLTLKNILQTAIVGVFTIHLIGIIYMAFLATIKHESLTILLGWIIAQSGAKIIYDLFFSFIAMIFAKYVKKILWFAMC